MTTLTFSPIILTSSVFLGKLSSYLQTYYYQSFMLRSMTAYGRATVLSPQGLYLAEIQSVNRKFLEVNAFIPTEFLRFEPEIKRLVASKISRGQVNLSLSVRYETNSPTKIIPNLPLAKELKKGWDEVAEALRLSREQGFNLTLLSSQKDLFYVESNLEREEIYREYIFKVIDQALDQAIEMKKSEGEALAIDMFQRLKFLKVWIEEIPLQVEDAPKKYRDKLMQRLEELLPGRVENEDRIVREIILFADKVDISEEITRFRSHLERLESLLRSEETILGKKSEFMIQELNREINTIGSKAADLKIAYRVVDIKTELEKIREQIQNVE